MTASSSAVPSSPVESSHTSVAASMRSGPSISSPRAADVARALDSPTTVADHLACRAPARRDASAASSDVNASNVVVREESAPDAAVGAKQGAAPEEPTTRPRSARRSTDSSTPTPNCLSMVTKCSLKSQTLSTASRRHWVYS